MLLFNLKYKLTFAYDQKATSQHRFCIALTRVRKRIRMIKIDFFVAISFDIRTYLSANNSLLCRVQSDYSVFAAGANGALQVFVPDFFLQSQRHVTTKTRSMGFSFILISYDFDYGKSLNRVIQRQPANNVSIGKLLK